MKSSLARLLFLLAVVFAQQGAFALAYAEDLNPDHQKIHDAGGACDACQHVACASSALAPNVAPSTCAAALEVPTSRKVDVAVLAVTAVYDSRAPPSLSL